MNKSYKNNSKKKKLKTKDFRIALIDSLKGIAIIGIIIVHSKAVDFPGILGKIAQFGAHGVQIFFIISALLTFKSLSNYEISSKKDYIKYCFNKFLRLIPLYYISLAIRFSINGFSNTYWAGTKGVTIFTYISNALFLHGLNPYYINAIDTNWYIGTLAIFIVIAPLLYKIINSTSKSIIFFFISFLIAIFTTFVIRNIYFAQDAYIWISYWSDFSILSELPILSIGIILYFLLIKLKIQNTIKEKCKSSNLKCITAILSIIIIIFIGENIIFNASLETFGFLFGIFIFIQFIHSNFITMNKLFSFLGKYSYGIYLFHTLIYPIIENFISFYITNIYIIVIISIILTIFITLLISFILTNLIEKPLYIKFKKD